MKAAAALLVLALAASAAPQSRACECVAHPKLPKHPLVIEGIALRKDLVNVPSKDGHVESYMRYSFKVLKHIRGRAGAEVLVYSTLSDCRMVFELGKVYRVTAGQYDDFGDQWFTGMCHDNRLIPRTRASIQRS